jgi:PAS domain S-box-containing protein
LILRAGHERGAGPDPCIHRFSSSYDEPDLVLLCRLNLEAEGFEVREARTGREALDAVASDPPGVVVLDVMMPELDGWHVLAALRSDPATADLPVVMLSARAHERDQIRGWQLGATNYLTKPFDPEQMVRAVRDALAPKDPEEIERRRSSSIERLRSSGQEAAYQLAAIVESSDDAIISKTLDGTITSWNSAAERIYGYGADEILGRSVTTIVPRELHPEVHEILERIRRGEQIAHFETVRVRKDGTRIDVSLAGRPSATSPARRSAPR